MNISDEQKTLLRSLYKDGLTFHDVCTKLQNKEPFTYSRFGDGEFAAIYAAQYNEPGANCDGHQYFQDMGFELAEILKSKRSYHIGIDTSERPAKVQKTLGFLIDNDLTDKQYARSDLFHIALVHQHFKRFFEAISERDIIVIGPQYLDKLAILSEGTGIQHIIIPDSNCWLYTDDVLERLLVSDVEGKVLLFIASMAANVWIDRLWQVYGDSVTLIDLGSALDPYCSKMTRSFHKKLEI